MNLSRPSQVARCAALGLLARGIWYSRKPKGRRYQRSHRIIKGSSFFSLQVAANGKGRGWVAWDSNTQGKVGAIAVG